MKKNLKPRQAEILRYLMTSSQPLDIAFFKEKISRGERTIRYDLQELKEICSEYGVEIRYLTKRGYYIPASQKPECSGILLLGDPDVKEGAGGSTEEKNFYRIFFYLLIQKSYIPAEKIAEASYMSRSTLNRFLGRMEEFFQNQFRLEVKKAVGYRLSGEEMALRRLAAGYLSARFKGSYTADDWYLLLPERLKDKIRVSDIQEISKSIRKMNAKYNIWISNTAYLNIISYCIVRFIRIPLLPEGQEIFTGEATYVEELLKKLSVRNRGRTACELEGLAEILKENGIYAREENADDVLVQKIVDQILLHLRNREDRGRFQLEELRQDLYEHLKSYLSMSAQERMEDENEYVLGEIRDYYSFYYQLAWECAEAVKAEMGKDFSTMEVCYLAVYLYKNSIHTEEERKNVIIVCATGKGLSHFLTLRIKSVFPMLNVVGQISPYQLSRASDLKHADFAISTIPLEDTLIPVVKISGALLEDDIKRIQDFLRYGKMLDEIPMKQKEDASFLSKEEPLLLDDVNPAVPDGRLAEASTAMSRLILTLLEYTAKLPPEVQLSQDAMLGMIIHMSMAVPRWFAAEKREEENEEYRREYYRVKEQYPDVFYIMEKFFELVEKTFQVKISISERTAFFLYIIEEV